MMRRTRLSFCQLQKRILTTGGSGPLPTYLCIGTYTYLHLTAYLLSHCLPTISLPNYYLTAYLLSPTYYFYLPTISLPTYYLSTYRLSLSLPTIYLPAKSLPIDYLFTYLPYLYLPPIYISLYLTSPICHGETRLYS